MGGGTLAAGVCGVCICGRVTNERRERKTGLWRWTGRGGWCPLFSLVPSHPPSRVLIEQDRRKMKRLAWRAHNRNAKQKWLFLLSFVFWAFFWSWFSSFLIRLPLIMAMNIPYPPAPQRGGSPSLAYPHPTIGACHSTPRSRIGTYDKTHTDRVMKSGL